MEPLTQSVLVGVTGPGENTDALRFAISEARTLGRGLTLVHAVHPLLPPPPPSILMTDDTWSDVGRTIMDEARGELEGLLGEASLPVDTVLRHGDPGSIFAELSTGASMVVLQRRDLSRLHRIVTSSTVTSVAAHAHCPVVSVPAGVDAPPTAGRVTVGVHGDGGPREVVEAAFAEASARRCELAVVHAWRLAAYYDDMLADEARWTAQDEARIVTGIEELRSKYPDVVVRVDVRHDWPADVLVDAAKDSAMVVVGRHSGLSGLPARLGPLTRAVIAHARGPVMIVPLS
jgi:nucleotide-binding universal stress UspA family protein